MEDKWWKDWGNILQLVMLVVIVIALPWCFYVLGQAQHHGVAPVPSPSAGR